MIFVEMLDYLDKDLIENNKLLPFINMIYTFAKYLDFTPITYNGFSHATDLGLYR